MPEKLIFKPMIDERGMPFVAYEQTKGQYVAGDWVPGDETPVERFGVLLPFSDDDLRYSESGTYSVKDRKLFTAQELKMGQKIEYKGISYTVQNFKDLSDYADVFIYVARWAGNENRTN